MKTAILINDIIKGIDLLIQNIKKNILNHQRVI